MISESIQASFGPYRVIRKLGEGGMAEVFLARRTVSDSLPRSKTKDVALKRIRAELADNPGYGEMLVEEARLGAALQHPNLVEAYDVGDQDGQLFFTMELVRGQQLRDVVRHAAKTMGRLPLAHAIAIVVGVAAGLHHAHQLCTRDGLPLRLAHLDVCPSNVLVGDQGDVKLIDFGIAKTDRRALMRLVRDGSWVGPLPPAHESLRRGTAAYMSPEQCLGSPTLDHRSDVFSLGIILWELTAWRRLFRDSSPDRVIDRIVNDDAPSPRSLDPSYPAGLEPIVLRALERDPSRRFQSTRQLQQTLEDFAFAQGLHASPTHLAQLMKKLAPPPVVTEERRSESDDVARRFSSIGQRWATRRMIK